MNDANMEIVQQISGMLHDLCQPLTALQCRLELAEVEGDAVMMQRAIVDGLVECARLNAIAAQMREYLRGAMQL